LAKSLKEQQAIGPGNIPRETQSSSTTMAVLLYLNSVDSRQLVFDFLSYSWYINIGLIITYILSELFLNICFWLSTIY
jgi:hypothetical protein